jgi:hypothetical protein
LSGSHVNGPPIQHVSAAWGREGGGPATGQQLRVQHVITGRFRRQDDRVAVTVEGMDVANDEIVWHGSLDVTSKDVLKIRQELTAALQKGLLPALGIANVELPRTKPRDQEAYELFLHSQNGPHWTVARNKEAIAMLEKSVALDPGKCTGMASARVALLG